MEENNLTVTVCMGSSCFSKGSKKIVETIERLQEEHIDDKKFNINLSGCLCQNECLDGPVVIINGQKFKNVSEISIIKILKENSELF